MNDFRIYGITATDTIEVPFLMKISSKRESENKVDFRLLNFSNKGNDYFFTFEIPSEKPINEIHLDFKEKNFNWLVNLEGSQNNSEWFTVLENYRILSIENKQTDYQFTNLVFPSSKYRYFRLRITSDKKPELITAETQLKSYEPSVYKNYPVKNFLSSEDKKLKKSIIDIDLPQDLPVSFISLKIKDSVDYYRPITIKFLLDSVNTEKGWKYNYNTLSSSILSSLENNDLHFQSTITRKLRLEIENFDNRPLQIEGATVKGYLYQLVARFEEPAKYFLVYGNPKAQRPNYDITNFSEKIPKDLSPLSLSEEKKIDKREVSKRSPIFENKLWLWIIMGIIIIVLGYFTIKMMGKK